VQLSFHVAAAMVKQMAASDILTGAAEAILADSDADP
jgi:hypothetical protein